MKSNARRIACSSKEVDFLGGDLVRLVVTPFADLIFVVMAAPSAWLDEDGIDPRNAEDLVRV